MQALAIQKGRRLAQERLQKVLASRGISSRRAAERLIAQGTVTVNGQVAAIGQSVDPDWDEIRVDGRLVVSTGENRYLALHKPEGYVTSTVSEHGERTVMDLIDIPERVYPVGRLDVDTAGLLLLTNDGEWANLVIHPKYEVDKEYVVVVRGHLSRSETDTLQGGIRLPGGDVTSPAKLEAMHRSEGATTLRITVHEGKKRQIRLMMAAVGHPVIKLTRVRVGPLRLGALAKGTWRELTPAEVDAIRASADVGKHGLRQ
jgi:23S rRNA pseudouridine2605 synthase